MERVLVLCGHNSARSQMAEAYLRMLGGDDLEVESAGYDPRPLNPFVITVMKEEGIDLSRKEPKDVFDLYRSGRSYDYVITVCSDGQESNCPIFPRLVRRLHLPFPDPAGLEGTPREVLDLTRQIRDVIKERMGEFIVWVRKKGEEPLPSPWQTR